jgi:hypothetical protein
MAEIKTYNGLYKYWKKMMRYGLYNPGVNDLTEESFKKWIKAIIYENVP